MLDQTLRRLFGLGGLHRLMAGRLPSCLLLMVGKHQAACTLAAGAVLPGRPLCPCLIDLHEAGPICRMHRLSSRLLVASCCSTQAEVVGRGSPYGC